VEDFDPGYFGAYFAGESLRLLSAGLHMMLDYVRFYTNWIVATFGQIRDEKLRSRACWELTCVQLAGTGTGRKVCAWLASQALCEY
jgi:hypothetical protein